MNKIEQLKQAAYVAMNAYQEAEAIERDKYNKTMIGKCFKYRNSGGGCDSKWWLYVKITRAEDGHLRVFKFEQLPNGCVSIEPDQFSYNGKIGLIDSGYQEIEHSELSAAWDAMFDKIEAESADIGLTRS
jgi:hypothetical protein